MSRKKTNLNAKKTLFFLNIQEKSLYLQLFLLLAIAVKS